MIKLNYKHCFIFCFAWTSLFYQSSIADTKLKVKNVIECGPKILNSSGIYAESVREYILAHKSNFVIYFYEGNKFIVYNDGLQFASFKKTEYFHMPLVQNGATTSASLEDVQGVFKFKLKRGEGEFDENILMVDMKSNTYVSRWGKASPEMGTCNQL